MDRRSLLRGATALAGIPILGRYVIDNPMLMSGRDAIADSTPALLLPEKQALVIASEMPARNVKGFTMWPTSWQMDVTRDVDRLYDWAGNPVTVRGAPMANIRIEGMLSHADDINALRNAFSLGTQFRVYVEPESG